MSFNTGQVSELIFLVMGGFIQNPELYDGNFCKILNDNFDEIENLSGLFELFEALLISCTVSHVSVDKMVEIHMCYNSLKMKHQMNGVDVDEN